MRTRNIHFWLFCLICTTLSITINFNSAFGATINVPGAPYPTIQAGIDAAVDGDTVLVADGTYTGEGNKNLDFKGKAITVISENGPYATIIDCEGEGRGFYFHNGEGQGSVLSGFTITNGKDIGITGAGVYINGSSPVIRNNIISNNQGWGVSTLASSNPLIQENIIQDNSSGLIIWASQPDVIANSITNNSGAGIESVNTRTFYILNNIIAENGGNGLDFLLPTGSDGSAVVINNTIIANSGHGISGNRDADLTLVNNILANNQLCGVFFETSYDWGLPDSNYNNVWENGGGNYCELAGPGANDISAEPLFVDSAAGDYHLWPNSPCIDAGTSEGAPLTDFDGDNRPIDGNADGNADFDIGVDEASERLNHDIAVQTMLAPVVPIKFGTNFTPEAKVINFGANNENNVSVTCEISQNSTVIYSDSKTLPLLDSMDSADIVFAVWTPQDAGEYELKIYTQLAGDENSANDSQTRSVRVTLFKAEFEADVIEGIMPLAVKFNDLSTGEPAEWLWDFGDGNESNEQNPTHTYTVNGIYTVSLTISNGTLSDTETKVKYITVWREVPDIFGIEIGNSWTYQGTFQAETYSWGKEVVSLDETTFSPRSTYVVEYTAEESPSGKDWLEKSASELKLWGERDIYGDFYGYSNGLINAWYPMQVGDRRLSTATTRIEGYTFNVSLTADVLALETVNLGFDAFDAYKVRYRARVWGYGADVQTEFYYWVLPYLGFVKYQDEDATEMLTSFAIGGGTITDQTDADNDGLKDYEELIIYASDWQNADSDNDGLSDGEEVNTYGTNPADADSDNDGLNDGEEVNTHGTDPTSEDTDDDGLSDFEELDTYNTDPTNADSDGDELSDGDEIAIGTDPNDSDTDADGMPDGWEDEHDLDPLTDDAGQDPDKDGLTNYEEYERGRHPTNVEPDTPELYLPADAETMVALAPQLQTGDFLDTDGHDHGLTQWQIGKQIGNPQPCTEESFTNSDYMVFDGTSDTQLTLFNVPDMLLDVDTGYCWRARFTDTGNATSEWADPFSFSTIAESDEDQNPHNGIPDDQEADCLGIFDPDAIPLNTACVNTLVANAQVGIEPGAGITSIDAFQSVHPLDIPENLSGVALLIGLMSFKAQVDQAGTVMQLTFHSSEPMPAGAKCYKYDPINGWQDYSAHIVAISADRKSITLEYQDGGFGDLDGVANKIVIDPIGFGVAVAGSGGSSGGGGGGGGGGGCLISTTATESDALKDVLLITLVLGAVLMGVLKLAIYRLSY